MQSNHGIYLDHAATTQMADEVASHLTQLYSLNLSNPSAVHGSGQAARDIVEKSRATIADRIHAQPDEIVFTSGGTEGNNWVLQRVVDDAQRDGNLKPHIVTSSIEHSSINRLAEWLHSRGQIAWTKLAVDSSGVVDADQLKSVLQQTPKPALVSVGHANNEIGVIQNIHLIGDLCGNAGVLFHSDACQTFCHLPLDVRDLPVDFLTLNSHKIRGPKGIGAMYIRSTVRLSPLLIGGMQERGHRSGTIPVELISGFALASTLWSDETERRILRIKSTLIQDLRSEFSELCINGLSESDPTHSLNHVLSLTLKSQNSRTLVSELSKIGIHCSAGAACNAGSFDASAVLLALGRAPEDAHHLRVSFGASTRPDDCLALISGLKTIIQ